MFELFFKHYKNAWIMGIESIDSIFKLNYDVGIARGFITLELENTPPRW